VSSFSKKVIAWQKKCGRHDLPWQNTTDGYRIWVSEIMLQQTQVAAVIDYYARFMQRFANLQALAQARQEAVMQAWSGLGYYSRARNLHRTAQILMRDHGGKFPRDLQQIEALPGIGRSTAAAIAVFAHGTHAAILDGNVKRVLARAFALAGYPGSPAVQTKLWSLAQSLLPTKDIQAYTQGLMDLGATVCARNKPQCGQCPIRTMCMAYAQGRVAQLPERKPVRAVPVRRATLWILQSSAGIWLEPRPGAGIWGGLLSLPQSDDHWQPGEPMPPALPPFKFAAAPQTLPVVAHAFTHFKLLIQPVLIMAALPASSLQQNCGRFIAPCLIAQAALPAPVKKLLLGLSLPD
jgi:A/G-specific adenine glycosylase